MNKEEFIKKLRKRLDVLEDKEIDDIVSEYTGYIEEKVNTGLTEEEAVKELGDFDEIVSDLLAAYKVKEPKSNWTFNSFINKISAYIDKFMEDLNNKSAKDILKIVIEIILIIIVISILKFPFSILKDFGWSLFHEIGTIGRTFYSIWAFLIELCYFILAIVMFIKIVDKRYFKGISEKIVDDEIDKDSKKKKNRVNSQKKDKEEQKIEDPKKSGGFIDSLSNVCIAFLKVIVFFILIGIIFYLIGMAFAIGIAIYLLISGVKYFGIAILLVALFLGGILLLELAINFIFNKRIKAYHVLGSLLTIIILTGFGLTLGAAEIADTEIIYDSNYNKKTEVKEIKMRDDLKLSGYNEVIIDDSLTDTFKIEYVYPDIDGLEVSIDLVRCHNRTCLDFETNHFHLSKAFLDNVIKSLKERKIYVYDYDIKRIIYISSENYKKLKNQISTYDDDSYLYSGNYRITNIIEDDDNYLKVTLYPYGNISDTETVKVPRKLASDLLKDKDYDFTFECDDDFDNNETEDIFRSCKLINIKYAE